MFQYRIYVGCNVPAGEAYSPGTVESVGLRRCPFYGCTVQHVKGVWKGEEEQTVVFEYVGGGADQHEVIAWAKLLKTDFSQEAVMVTSTEVTQLLV